MAEAVLQALRRTVFGKHVKNLRREGMLPANVNVKHDSSVAIQLDTREFEDFLKKHGVTTLITLEIAEASGGRGTTRRPIRRSALLGEVQREAVSGHIQHIEFQQVSLDEPVRTHAPVVVTGEAPAVRILGGVLLHPLDSVEVTALPRDLPEAILADISGLTDLNSSLYVRDLPTPDNVTILTDPDEPVVTIQAPRTIVEEPAPAETQEAQTEATASTGAEPTANEG